MSSNITVHPVAGAAPPGRIARPHDAVAARVILPAGGAAAGSVYRANFIIGHACKGASTTTGVTVTLPAGFTLGCVATPTLPVC